MSKTVRIGGASGAWGDSAFASRQLLAAGRCDYLVYDGLAEITMGILTRARMRDPERGYATDIIEDIARVLDSLQEGDVRVITNAGGVNPLAAGELIRRAAAEAGVPTRVATVTGDDITDKANHVRALGLVDVHRNEPLPEEILNLNVYLGARPIAAALDAGADVVVTGRVADSALALGALIHEFRWEWDDWDLLSAGSLAGHLIECGPQATGGLATDWDRVPGWAGIGYPIVECAGDGTFDMTKPSGTGGLVAVETVAEQLLYEIGDPANYLLPDVTCDWTEVELHNSDSETVHVSGARGRPPVPTLKANAHYVDGANVAATVFLGGRDATAKAERLAEEALERGREVLRSLDVDDFRDINVEVIGAESTYGPHARSRDTREVILRIALHHDDEKALRAVVRELPSFGLVVPGFSLGGSGPPKPTPRMAMRSFSIPRDMPRPEVILEGDVVAMRHDPMSITDTVGEGRRLRDTTHVDGDGGVEVPLIAIAHGRSGDKGPDANIGIRARDPDFLPAIHANVTASAVRNWLRHVVTGEVHRYALPGTCAINLHLIDALGGGGTSSLRIDPQGKALAQQLLDMPVLIPPLWIDHPAILDIPEIRDVRERLI